ARLPDGQGKTYVAHGYSKIFITELDTNFTAKGNDVLVYTGDIRPGLEGTHVYKINGYYYLYCTYGGGDGFQVALRSKNIYGPYEQKIVIRDNGNLSTGIHQGALIETQTGEWWSVIFQDGGAFGRFPTLQPVTWQDDWPMVGVNGKGVITYKKPNVGKTYPIKILPTSDEFDTKVLNMQWGWNHNPDSTNWSLSQNPGYLRLATAKVVSKLQDAVNTLTQRIFAYYSKVHTTTATIKMNVDNMQEGDIAGLAVFQNPYAFIGIKKTNGAQYVIMVNNGKTIDSVAVNISTIYLRAQANYGSGRAFFEYSLDNQSFKLLGNELAMQFNLSIFTGNKFCLFNYATLSTGGWVDIDWFRTEARSIRSDIEDSQSNGILPNFRLEQNYPNPFNPETTISYTIPASLNPSKGGTLVSLKIFDLLGREVETLVNEFKQPGVYNSQFSIRNSSPRSTRVGAGQLSSGIYLCRLEANNFSETKKLILLK
ncbi:MAG: family 43 glycosylhydrolase, partial [Ignavibacteria bacterium]|nr:family 43 glycosylhydrolase [Ignavibacteria bacterium]